MSTNNHQRRATKCLKSTTKWFKSDTLSEKVLHNGSGVLRNGTKALRRDIKVKLCHTKVCFVKRIAVSYFNSSKKTHFKSSLNYNLIVVQ